MYEVVIEFKKNFADFMNKVSLIKEIGAKDVYIRYHVPDIEYMLFGVHLFILGRLSYSALGRYIVAVTARGNLHRQVISEIAQEQKINVIIESPFENLCSPEGRPTVDGLLEILSLSNAQMRQIQNDFPAIFESLMEDCDLTRPNFNSTSIDSSESADYEELFRYASNLKPAIISLQSDMRLLRNQRARLVKRNEDTAENERESEEINRVLCLFQQFFIENLLLNLVTRSFHPIHQSVWRKIKYLYPVEQQKPCDLFKLGNLAMLVMEAKHEGPSKFEVCCMLPIDEKIISVDYSKLFRQKFGHSVSLFCLPPVLSTVNAISDEKGHQNDFFIYHSIKYKMDFYDLLPEIEKLIGPNGDFSELILRHSADKKLLSASEKPARPTLGRNRESVFSRSKSASAVLQLDSAPIISPPELDRAAGTFTRIASKNDM